MLCKDGGLSEKLGIYTQRDGNNSIQILQVKVKECNESTENGRVYNATHVYTFKRILKL